MKNLQFPLHFTFKISTLSNDFIVKDFKGDAIGFVKQKLFKLVEEIKIYHEESKQNLIYTIKANRWLDFSATYVFYDSQEKEIGRVVRKGWKSLWRARYEIYDHQQQLILNIQENSGWVLLLDGLLREIPILNLLTNYLFNPSYKVMRPDGKVIIQLKKDRSFLGRHFTAEKLEEFKKDEEECGILGLMMMSILEKYRG